MNDALKFKTDMQFAYGVPSNLAPGVARIVANNASALTFKGTNTYLLGTGELAVIDAGPADPRHVSAILRAADGRRITHILMSLDISGRDCFPGLSELLPPSSVTSVVT
jgi:hypothetical protein